MIEQDERNILIETLKMHGIAVDFPILKSMTIDGMYTYLKERSDEDTFSRVYLQTKVMVKGAYDQYLHVLRSMSSLEETNGLEIKMSTKIFIACVSSKVVDNLISLMRELTSNDERKLFIRIKIKDLGDIHTNIAILDEFNDEDEEFKFLVLYYRILISHLSQAAKIFDIDIFEESEKIGLDYFISDRYGFPAEKKNENLNKNNISISLDKLKPSLSDWNKPILDREQINVMFNILKDCNIINKDIQRKSLDTSISLLTGYSEKQIHKGSNTPTNQIINDKSKITDIQNALKSVIDKLEEEKRSIL